MKKGYENAAESVGLAMKMPLRPSPNTSPTDRAMLVMPLAAERSSLETTKATQVCLAGTSICEMQKRAKRKMMLMSALPVRGMRRRKMLEGRCVQIMVAIAPILSTSFEERTPLMPLTMLHPKSTAPMAWKCRSYLVSKQQERQLCTTKAPAKASTANRALRLMMVFVFSGLMPLQVTIFLSWASWASIQLRFMKQQQVNMNPPSSAQMRTTFAVASTFEQSRCCQVSSMKNPAKMAPRACETYPAMLQYPKTAEVYLGTSSLLSTQSSTSWERADCSMGMKGPISPPVTEMTPKMPLMVRMVRLLASAQNMPVRSLRKEPNMRVLTLPMRSARVVRMSEMMMSPKTMADCTHEASLVVRPLQKRLSKNTTASMPYENIRMILVTKSRTKSLRFC